jgi:hypothetical protein
VKWLFAGTERRAARTACIDRIATGVDGAGIRQRQMYEADTGDIRRHLVDDPVRTQRTALPAFHPALHPLIAVKRDLIMRRFGQNCDDVLTKFGKEHTPRCSCAVPSYWSRSEQRRRSPNVAESVAENPQFASKIN